MGLFDKKFCSVCGQKVGTLFHRKLEDGFLCKDCTAKLSPFFSERRASTADEIRQQLAYREENRAALADFHITRTLGRDLKVHLDEDSRRFVVTRSKNIQEDNPDIIAYSQVTGVEVDANESQSEAKRRDSEGRMVSYVPPRFTFNASVRVLLRVNSPWFDSITIPVGSSVTLNPGNPLPGSLRPAPKTNREFLECWNIAKDIEHALTAARTEARSAVTQPKKAVVCPCCGATTIPDAAGCCEYCGGATGA